MQVLKLYRWEDKELSRPVREIDLLRVDDLTRNSKKRLFAWSGDEDEMNYLLYPDYGTAYPEFDNRIQKQRPGIRYRFVLSE
ncbi:hypothetical protein KDL29_01885 [bacterium]|nr:hypothetical protein [bacterium]MCB1220151.1 hypothetical protein [bacterium]UNM07004.1 MAG: hypothetical protein H7A35_08945 [Planctomycetales bacterium]